MGRNRENTLQSSSAVLGTASACGPTGRNVREHGEENREKTGKIERNGQKWGKTRQKWGERAELGEMLCKAAMPQHTANMCGLVGRNVRARGGENWEKWGKTREKSGKPGQKWR